VDEIDIIASQRFGNRAKILIVDDEESIRKMLCRILENDGYLCVGAEDAQATRSILNDDRFDLIICDIIMPGESGMDLLSEIITRYPDMAVLMMSGYADTSTAKAAIALGAYGYLCKPFQQKQVLVSVASALRYRAIELQNRFQFEHLETMAGEKLQKALEGTIRAMSKAFESRDPFTTGHQQRVAHLASAIALEMNLPTNQLDGVRMAGIIHDIGKISVPAEILSKPTRLTDAEYHIIKTHARTGYLILKEVEFPWPLADIVHQHHERLDGSGYPLGLKEDQILLEAKIIAVADVAEAMASHRPYRPSLGIDAAMDEISLSKGRLYDPVVSDICCDLFLKKGFTFA
jgi:putative two-component system response regulator